MNFRQLNLLIVLSTILVSGSLYYASFLKNILLIPLLALLMLYFLNPHKRDSRGSLSINRNKCLALLFAAMLAVSNLHSVFSSLMVLSACMLCALIITEMISFNDFAKFYIKIMLFLSVASWLYYPVLLFHMPSPLPDFTSIVDAPYSNFLFFGIFRPEMPEGYLGMYYINRNAGLFWEPGAFQIFVNTAFYLAIVQNQLTKKRFLIFLLTVLTIGSTTGTLVFGLLCAVYFSRTKRNRTVRKNRNLFAIGIIVGAIFFSSTIFSSAIEKFEEGSRSNVSFISRSTDYLVDTSVLVDHFWRGVGYGNIAVREQYAKDTIGEDLYWSSVRPQGADGLLLYLTYVGVFGLVVVWRLIYPSQIRNWSLFEKSLVMMAMVLMYNNENMLMYLFPWVMMFYGFAIHSKQAGYGTCYSQVALKPAHLIFAKHV